MVWDRVLADRKYQVVPVEPSGTQSTRLSQHWMAYAPKGQLAAYLRDRVADSLPSYLGGIAAIAATLSVAHWYFWPPGIALPLSSIAGGIAVLALLLFIGVRNAPRRIRRADLLLGAVSTLCLLQALLHVALTQRPEASLDLILILASISAASLSRGITYGSAVLGVVCWTGIAAPTWNSAWGFFAFWLAISLGVMALVFETRRRLYARLCQTEADLRRFASFDRLTGLPNRAYLLETLERLLEEERHVKSPQLGVCFVDLNGFKAINDTYGHEAGDRVLVAVADRLLRACRSEHGRIPDFVGRLGGDEFLLIVRAVRSQHDLEIAAQRYRTAAAQPIDIAGKQVTVSASVGTAWTGASSNLTVNAMLARADARMYRHKRRQDGAADYPAGGDDTSEISVLEKRDGQSLSL